LSQTVYSEQLLERFNIKGCTLASTPLPSGLALSSEDCPTSTNEMNEMAATPYQEALGGVMWLQVATRPDLMYAASVLSHFAHNPRKTHWNTMKHVLSYIKGTMHYGILY